MSATVCRILFFASLRDATQKDQMVLSLEAPVPLSGLLEKLATELPADAMTELQAENVRVAVNQTFLTGVGLIAPGDEVAFMPPVTGG
jgi:molybdopterin synthase sulfur carrier subunit